MYDDGATSSVDGVSLMPYVSPMIKTNVDNSPTGIPDLYELADIISCWEESYQEGLTDPMGDDAICKLYELSCVVYGKELLEKVLDEHRPWYRD